MIGLFVIFIYMVGTNSNGENPMVAMWNGSVSKNGLPMSLLLFAIMLGLGWLLKYGLDDCEKEIK